MSDRSGLFLEKHLCYQAALFLGDRLTIFQRNRTKLQYPRQGTDSHRDMSDRVGLILEKAYNGLKNLEYFLSIIKRVLKHSKNHIRIWHLIKLIQLGVVRPYETSKLQF